MDLLQELKEITSAKGQQVSYPSIAGLEVGSPEYDKAVLLMKKALHAEYDRQIAAIMVKKLELAQSYK